MSKLTFGINFFFSIHFCRTKIKKTIISILLLIKNFNKDIIILSFQSNITAIFVSKIFGYKIIIRLNTSIKKYINNIFKKFLYKLSYSFADEIIVNSNNFKKELKNEPIFVIYGDNYISFDLLDLKLFNKKMKADISILFHWREDITNSGIAEFDSNGQINKFIEIKQMKLSEPSKNCKKLGLFRIGNIFYNYGLQPLQQLFVLTIFSQGNSILSEGENLQYPTVCTPTHTFFSSLIGTNSSFVLLSRFRS